VCRFNGINNLRGSNTDFPHFSAFFHLNRQTNRQAIGKRDYQDLSSENGLTRPGSPGEIAVQDPLSKGKIISTISAFIRLWNHCSSKYRLWPKSGLCIVNAAELISWESRLKVHRRCYLAYSLAEPLETCRESIVIGEA
jgi:hypothetical protein